MNRQSSLSRRLHHWQHCPTCGDPIMSPIGVKSFGPAVQCNSCHSAGRREVLPQFAVKFNESADALRQRRVDHEAKRQQQKRRSKERRLRLELLWELDSRCTCCNGQTNLEHKGRNHAILVDDAIVCADCTSRPGLRTERREAAMAAASLEVGRLARQRAESFGMAVSYVG